MLSGIINEFCVYENLLDYSVKSNKEYVKLLS